MMMTKVLKNFRAVSCLRSHSISLRLFRNLVSISAAADIKFLPEKTYQQFESFYDRVTEDVISSKLIAPQPKLNEHLRKVFDHNVKTGRKIRPSLMMAAYQIMRNGENITEETWERLFIFCWALEIYGTAYVIQDDIVDKTTVRRNKPAWYKVVGMNAINDSIILESACEQLMKKYFGDHKHYIDIIEEYSKARRLTRVGQLLNSFLTSFDDFTMENYIDKAYYIMTSCTFHTPLRLTALFACKADLLESKEVVDVIKELGLLYSIMNDFMDCYAEKYFRKFGTDIQENICTWLILVALQRANAEQRKVLESCYGSYDEIKVQKVKQIYEELKIHEAYGIAERDSYDRVIQLMKKVTNKEAKYLLNEIIKVVYRKK